MELLKLRIFRDIAHEMSFVKAAKLSHLTQPAISVHIKHLEEELGLKLFDRAPRKVNLTKEGELLLPHAEELLSRSEMFKELAARVRHTPEGDLKIATIHSVGIYELAPFLQKSLRIFPKINIHLQYRRADIIYDLVHKEKIDLGIVAYPDNRSGIEFIPFAMDRLVMIVPPDHTLAKRKSAPLASIEGENFIAFEKNIPTGKAVSKVLSNQGVCVSIRMTNENIDTLKRAVEVGLGLSIVPEKTIKEEVKKGTLAAIQIQGAKITRPIGILILRKKPLSYAVQVFVDLLKNTKRENLHPIYSTTQRLDKKR